MELVSHRSQYVDPSVPSTAVAKLGMKRALSTVLPVNALFHCITDGMLQDGYFYPRFMAEEPRLQKVT